MYGTLTSYGLLVSDFTFEIRVSEAWDDRLQDTSSDEFKELAQLMKTEVCLTRGRIGLHSALQVAC